MLSGDFPERRFAHVQHPVGLDFPPVHPRDGRRVAEVVDIGGMVQRVINRTDYRFGEPLPHQVLHLRMLLPYMEVRSGPAAAGSYVFLQRRLLASVPVQTRDMDQCPSADLAAVVRLPGIVRHLHGVPGVAARQPDHIPHIISGPLGAKSPQPPVTVNQQSGVGQEQDVIASGVVKMSADQPI